MHILAFDTADEFCTLVLTERDQKLSSETLEAGRKQAALLAPMTEKFLARHNIKLADIDRLAICTGPGSFTGLRVGLSFARGLALAAQKPLLGFDHFACTREAVSRLKFPLPSVFAKATADAFSRTTRRSLGEAGSGGDKGVGITGEIFACFGPPPAPPEGRGEEHPLLILRASGRDELFACLAHPGEGKPRVFLATAAQLAEMLRAQPEIFFTGNGVGAVLEVDKQLASRHIHLAPEETAISAALLAEKAESTGQPLPEPLYLRDADVTFPRARA